MHRFTQVKPNLAKQEPTLLFFFGNSHPRRASMVY